MFYALRRPVLAVCFGLIVLTNTAIGRPRCPPAISEESDVTASVPCRPSDSKLLEFLADARIPASDGFVAVRHFVEGRPARELQITWIGSNFHRHLLAKIESPEPDRLLYVYQLRDSANDQAILHVIGSEQAARLYEVWVLLSNQSHGETGSLRTDGIPNLFYVHDDTGRLWAVDAVWSGAGWELGASRLNSVRRERGTRVFAR